MSIFRYGLFITGIATFWTLNFSSAVAAPQNTPTAPSPLQQEQQQVIKQPSLHEGSLPAYRQEDATSLLSHETTPSETASSFPQQKSTTSLVQQGTSYPSQESTSPPSSLQAIEPQQQHGSAAPLLAQHDAATATTSSVSPIEINIKPVEHSLSPWEKGAIVNILADQSPLAEVLKEFGNQMNIRVFSSPGVQGKVSGNFLNLTPQKFLDQLSRAYGLDWVYYNQQIYFSSSPESTTLIRTLKFLPANQGIKAVEQMGLYSIGSSIRGIPGTPMVMLTGPPKFLEIAQQVLYTLEEQTAISQTSEMVIQVFPLNYAWAQDVQLASTSVQGVATTLSRLVMGGMGGGRSGGINLGNYNTTAQPLSAPLTPGSQQASGSEARVFPPATGGMQQGSMPSSSQNSPSIAPGGAMPAGMAAVASANGNYGPVFANTNSISITADVRSNSVIVRDVRANMPFYKAAIAKLDVPVKVVEISAAIVDADVTSGRFLGFKGFDLKAANGLTFSSNTTSGPLDGNIKLSGVYGTNTITAALDFLEHNNKAKTLSRPTLVTLDNFAASIGNDETFYIQTTGGRDTPGSVYSVGSGLSLNVVPHITVENGQEQIYMQVTIQDSGRGGDTIGNLPTVKNTHLSTQSIVRRDQSLLIGGLYRTVDNKARSGYPWLSKIPIVGLAFGSHSKKGTMVERMILLTPRIVDIYSTNLGNYSRYFNPSPEMKAAGHQYRPAPSATMDASQQEIRRAVAH